MLLFFFLQRSFAKLIFLLRNCSSHDKIAIFLFNVEALMKRLFSLLFLLLLLFSFTSCSSKNSDDPETIVINNEIYTVDPVNGDIAHEDDLYHYTIDGDTITITYPDTRTYCHTYVDEGSWHSGSSDN